MSKPCTSARPKRWKLRRRSWHAAGRHVPARLEPNDLPLAIPALAAERGRVNDDAEHAVECVNQSDGIELVKAVLPLLVGAAVGVLAATELRDIEPDTPPSEAPP